MAFLLGEQKCGTTHFYWILRRHNQVCNSIHLETDQWNFMDKELHYFDETGSNATTDNRLQHFLEYTGHFRRCPRDELRIDATPDYLSHKYAADLLRSTYASLGIDNSALRFLVILRNPVERFVSAYEHLRRHELLPTNVSLREVAEREFSAYGDWKSKAKVGNEHDEWLRDHKVDEKVGDIISRGLYYQTLQSWFR